MMASSRSICALWASSYCRELCFCSSCEQHLRPVCCCDFKPRPCQLNDGLWKKSLVMRGDEEIPHADRAHAKALRACGARPQALGGQDDRFRPCLHSQHEIVAESGCARSPSCCRSISDGPTAPRSCCPLPAVHLLVLWHKVKECIALSRFACHRQGMI